MAICRAHFYDSQTGVFLGRTYEGPEIELAANTPIGAKAFTGVVIDSASQRVDLGTGAVIDYQPPAPSPDHEWNAARRRWQLSPVSQAAAVADQQARAAILATEETSARALREGLLELLPKSSPARQKLQAADDAIAAHRANITKG